MSKIFGGATILIPVLNTYVDWNARFIIYYFLLFSFVLLVSLS